MSPINKYIEVIHNMLPLLSTLEEGFHHIQSQLADLRYEEAFAMLHNVMEGIESTESAVEEMKEELPDNDVAMLLSALKKHINHAVNVYAQGEAVQLEHVISYEILPTFLNWKQELERVLKPFIAS